jgi:perosamine synthetase
VGASNVLAIDGGPQAVPDGAHVRWPRVTAADRRAWLSVLNSPASELGTPTSKYLAEFEAAMGEYLGVRHVVALGNGTAALAALLVGAGVEPGDRVVVPAVTFASPHAVGLIGARPVFCDINAHTYNMELASLDRTLARGGVKAIVATHLHGLAMDMGAVNALAAQHGVRIVIEDAAQGLGATHGGKPVGTLANGAAFSGNVAKLLQGHDLGWAVTDDADLALAVRRFSVFGEDRRRLGAHQASGHVAHGLGGNFRATPGSAALALSQMEHLPKWIATARRNVAVLMDGLRGVPGVVLPDVTAGSTSVHHLVRLGVNPTTLGWNGPLTRLRDGVVHLLKTEGLEAGLWMPVPYPEMPAFRRGDLRPWRRGADDERLSASDRERFQGAYRMCDATFVTGRVAWQVQREQLARQYAHGIRKVFRAVRGGRLADLDFPSIEIV